MRPGLADATLAGHLFAPYYARPVIDVCAAPAVALRAAPGEDAAAVSELKRGERFALIDSAGDWAWGYGLHDRYVGYLPVTALDRIGPPATHRIAARTAPLFAAPDIKAPVVAIWPIGARFAGTAAGDFIDAGEGYVHARHAEPAEAIAPDAVAVAERLIGAPYLWGGRGGGGIDCSGLVQLALAFAGVAAPRDSDQQRALLGTEIAPDAPLRRGDILFFPGHVGLMADGANLLHANAHWMATVIEPLADVIARAAGAGRPDPVIARRRI